MLRRISFSRYFSSLQQKRPRKRSFFMLCTVVQCCQMITVHRQQKLLQSCIFGLLIHSYHVIHRAIHHAGRTINLKLHRLCVASADEGSILVSNTKTSIIARIRLQKSINYLLIFLFYPGAIIPFPKVSVNPRAGHWPLPSYSEIPYLKQAWRCNKTTLIS